ncbi:MAG: 50S ribosomal protein L25 [Spirochaetia bacterium]|nr:50S ribosomal protein L25 [Spirochaetia bacterium]
MERVTMEAELRDGSVPARKLKKDGKVAAVVYGKETKSMPIEIKIRDIEKTVRTLSEGTLLITLKLTGKGQNEEKLVVIQEVQRDPMTDEIIHTDFHQISETEKTVFKVPVFPTGIAEGVKIGGILEHITRELNIRCIPKDLPAKLEVDVSPLKIGQSITIGEMKLAEGLEVMDPKAKTVFTVVSHKIEEEPTAAAAVPGAEGAAAAPGAEGAAGAEPELIKKERATAEGAEGAAAEKGKAPAAGKEEKKGKK